MYEINPKKLLKGVYMVTIDEFMKLISPLKPDEISLAEDCYVLRIRGANYYAPIKEIEEYVDLRDQLLSDPIVSLFYPGYYEHLIAEKPRMFDLKFNTRENDTFSLVNDDKTIKIEISTPSSKFLLSLLNNTDIPFIRRSSYYARFHQRENEAKTHWSKIFRNLMTIKVILEPEYSGKGNKSDLYRIAESTLFHIAFVLKEGIYLSHSLVSSTDRIDSSIEPVIQFPKRVYKEELVSYYQLALSSEHQMLRYISLYKILEFFYTSASEKELHKIIKDKLVQPDFSHTKVSSLRDLTKLIRTFDQKINEQQMLTTVIDLYFPQQEREIESWVISYESRFGTYYTKPQRIFNGTFSINFNSKRTASSIAQRIYSIRNTLVHNKDGDFERFRPFSGQDEILSKEIPLILFLAEQLIIKSGKDL